MKVAIYSPYLDTLGGGERYMMVIAQILSYRHSVDVLLDSHLSSFNINKLKKDLEERFALSLSKVSFKKAPLGKNSSFFQRLFFLKDYDLLFYLTDGSVFIPTAKRNILHIQTPLIGQPAKSLWGKLKLKSWNLIIYNSKFTQGIAEKNWPKQSLVIYPPVDVDEIKPLEKKKYILSVGRFFGYLRDKQQKVLIDAFKKLYKEKEMAGWSLHLAGSASEGDEDYIDELKDNAKGVPINFYPNLRYGELVKLYGQSSIYWHASGFEENDPTKMEHFGITTVEAMAGGCVPVVIGKGGQIEIVEQGENGFLWNTKQELIDHTKRLIKEDKLFKSLSANAVLQSKKFSKSNFKKNIEKLLLTGDF